METEILSGGRDSTVASKGARIPIVINRQGSGVLGYFKNVPADIGGTTVRYLRLTVSNSNKNVNLTTGIGASPTGVSYNLINMDLRGQTGNGDGAYSGNDLSAAGGVKVANSQLSGACVRPVNVVTVKWGS